MTLTIPSTFIRPTVRLDLNDDETMLLRSTSGMYNLLRNSADPTELFQQILEQGDSIFDSDAEHDPNEPIVVAQTSLFLIGRFFAAAIRHGNTIEDVHQLVGQMLTTPPTDTHAAVLDCAEVDLSDLTGVPATPPPPVDDKMERLARRAERTFYHTAANYPATTMWAKMGINLGLDDQHVAVAAGSHLDFTYIMGDVTCTCEHCTEDQ